MDKIIISDTGEQHGYGTARYKWVSGLTREEREAVKSGEIVLITGCRRSGGGNGTGTTVRQVIYEGGRYLPRVPDADTLKRAEVD